MVAKAVGLFLIIVIIVGACFLVHLADGLKQTEQVIGDKLSIVTCLAVYAGIILSSIVH